jgi:hypothetical protein
MTREEILIIKARLGSISPRKMQDIRACSEAAYKLIAEDLPKLMRFANCWPEIEAVLKAVDRARSVDHNFQCIIHTSKVACSCGLTALDNAYHDLESKMKGM